MSNEPEDDKNKPKVPSSTTEDINTDVIKNQPTAPPSVSKAKAARKQTRKIKTKEERVIRAIGRLRNEERIKRLTKWMQEILLQRTKDIFVERQIINARKANANANIASVRQQALKHCSKWTIKNIVCSLPSHLLMGQILTRHQICSWRDGDMSSTWHIAFHETGYKTEFPLDRDGLPVEPPGAKRADIITRVRKKADHKTRKGRLGIISDRDRDRKRDSRSEWRIFLLRFDKGDGKLNDDGVSPGYEKQIENMNRRHKGEKHQKALLKEAATVNIKKSATMVDAVLDAWTKEGE